MIPHDNPIKGMPGGSVTGCIDMMGRRGDIEDPGAYCAAIADRIEPGWRENPQDAHGVTCPRWAVEMFVEDRQSDNWKVPRRGGLADGLSARRLPKRSLVDGLCVELEHTMDWRTALGIAMDHLVEDTDYYPKLALMESNPRVHRMARRLAEGGR